MVDAPTGTVTFLFTDIEGSTRLLQQLGEGYREVQERHDEILRASIDEADGYVVRTEGDSFFATFTSAVPAIHAAVAAQRALAQQEWPAGPLRVRMGLHTGEGVLLGGDYLGIDVNRAARIAAAGQGGQILLSESTLALVEHALPEGVTSRDLGAHRLKDIEHPERIHDLVIDGLLTEFPPIRSLGSGATNLPMPRTSFVGRRSEMEGIAALLDQTRLLTLTGPGGTGKTRIALEVASRLHGRFKDGASFVSLESVADPTLVTSTIAATLVVRDPSSQDSLEALTRYLRDRNLLLLLDNFEQVVEAGPVVDHLLGAAPGLSILVTSRVPLHLSWEQEYRVPPLTLPDPEAVDVETAAASESVMLFVERAAAVRPGFRLSEETAGAVAGITARLDGVPLAIELAASRTKILSPDELLARLERRLPLLTGGARDLPERQRTLRSAIAWSYDLLEADERGLFARLAVFAGGWSLAAAEAVCGPGLAVDVLDGLGTLVDDSLVLEGSVSSAETRFRMLETIREFAAEQLDSSGDEEEMHRRHARYMTDLAEEAEPNLTRETQADWFRRLEQEHDNFRVALDWAERTGDADTAARIASPLWRFWQQQGHLAEGRARLERVMAMPGSGGRDAVRTRGLGALGGVAYWQGDYEGMEAAWEEAVEIAREIGDPGLIARAIYDYSFVPRVNGDFDGAEALLAETLTVARQAGDRTLIGYATLFLGYGRVQRGDLGAGMSLVKETVAIARETQDRLFLTEALGGLSSIEIFTGDVSRAKEHLLEIVRLQTAAGNRMGLAAVLVPMSMIASHDGRYELAARLNGTADRMREELGGGPPAIAYSTWGDSAEEARRALGRDAYERAWGEGRIMTMDEVVSMFFDDMGS